MRIPSEIEVTRTATDWLHAELATLTPEQWETPAACGIWSVAEVVAHLDWGARMYADVLQRALDGIAGPPPDSGAIAEYATRAAWFAEKAQSHRLALGDRLLDAFLESGRALIELYERLSSADWQLTAPHPASPRPMREMLRLRIVEVTIHGWDVLYRLDRTNNRGILPPGSHEPLVDWLPRRIEGSFARGAPLPEPIRILFVLTSPLLRLVHVRIRGDGIDVDPEWDESGSDAVVTIHPETYILLFMDRLTWRQALEADALGVTGRRDIVPDLQGWFRPG